MTEGKIDFSQFILSLAQTVLIDLGEIEHPESKEKKENLNNAKYTIQILEMIEEKTRGNLMDEERRLLESILFDLRFKYVAKVNEQKTTKNNEEK